MAVRSAAGNHDADAPFSLYITPLHYTIEHFGGLTFGGFGGSWRYKPRGHHLYDQEEVVKVLRSFPRVDVFVAHNSPRGYHERDDDVHQGFEGFHDYILRAKPEYFLHGHQHLNEKSMIGATTLIGVFGEDPSLSTNSEQVMDVNSPTAFQSHSKVTALTR